MADFVTNNIREFPNARFRTEFMRTTACKAAAEMLMTAGTRPTPERVNAVLQSEGFGTGRAMLDHAFAISESVTIPPDPEKEGFDPGYPRLSPEAVRQALEQMPENRKWIGCALNRTARRHGLVLSENLQKAASHLLGHLCRNVSFWEADAFPLEAMTDLKNRYGWTFSTDAWSLREQLRREALVVREAWKVLLGLAGQHPLLVIPNATASTDYMTCALPPDAALFSDPSHKTTAPILLHTGLKIASSEHRDPLAGTPEGTGLEAAADTARKLGRRAVLLDFSRRRFPRSFMRVARFARQRGWGIEPVGKVRDPGAEDIPGPKSPRGFAPAAGDPVITLFDPWPVSDPKIISGLTPAERATFCVPPQTKPWQDDRIGARTEIEAGKDGICRMIQMAWAVPVLGGWMRADDLFRSRLARFFNPSGEKTFCNNAAKALPDPGRTAFKPLSH